MTSPNAQPPAIDPLQVFTLSEVARLMQVCERKIQRDIERGLFPAGIVIGRKSRRWRRSDIEAYLSGKWQPEPEAA